MPKPPPSKKPKPSKRGTPPPPPPPESEDAPDETNQAPATLPAWRQVNRVELAALIGVHPETITAYVRTGMPVHKAGRRGQESAYDAVACLEWWRREQGNLSAKEIAQTRAYEAQAKLNELKLSVQQGALLAREQVVFEGQAYTKAWAAQVRSLPRRARQAGVVHTPEDEAALADLCRQILTEISSWTTPADATRSADDADGAAA